MHNFRQSGFDTRDSFFIKEVPLPTENLVDASEEKISRMISDGKSHFVNMLVYVRADNL